MQRLFLPRFFSLALLLASVVNASLVSGAGQAAAIPSWKVQSSETVGNDATKLSDPNYDVFDWYTIGSKGTLMATLIENNVYDESSLFFSDNLDTIDKTQFQVPWFYRAEFELDPPKWDGERYFLLETHGISSKADIYLNGVLVASNQEQVGAYGGRTYDITKAVKTWNVLLLRVYPTDYNKDFAVGFVDWNPYPPDNGTGVWRDVEIRQTGILAFQGAPSVTHSIDFCLNPAMCDATVNVGLKVANLGSSQVSGYVTCSVTDPQGTWVPGAEAKKAIPVSAKQTISYTDLDLILKIEHPERWYPKQWGAQPLYNVSCVAFTDKHSSPLDSTQTFFGLRNVGAHLNEFNHVVFSINGKPFQVLGAGYTSDIFLRFDEAKIRAQFQYVLDMGLNTVRLEGKQEHPRFYELADEMGIMIIAGWECCDKWEGWSYNDEGSGEKWEDADYVIANASVRHEAKMMQHHPSMLAFLVGSDFWPDDRATRIYVDALKPIGERWWDVPIIASASQRGYPALLGNGGMKMDGPYDWVPPNLWWGGDEWDIKTLGAAWGFGSELGAGVGTPELRSLEKFLSRSDLDDLWVSPTKGLYHMSQNTSSFHTRTIYNKALWARFGAPSSLENYLLKAQLMDYEATRAQFEAYASKWTADERPATGLIYWMLNNAWPSLHWNLFDYYLHPAGSYFGAKVGSRLQHITFDYEEQSFYLINRSLLPLDPCTAEAEWLDLNGNTLDSMTVTTKVAPNDITLLYSPRRESMGWIKDVALLKLVLKREGKVLSRNVYHLTPQPDHLDYHHADWYHTPVKTYANFTALNNLTPVDLSVKAAITTINGSDVTAKVVLHNHSKIPAVFIRLNLIHAIPAYKRPTVYTDIVPVWWSDNYVTLWPGEVLELEVKFQHDEVHMDVATRIEVSGWNVESHMVGVSFAGGARAGADS